MKLSEKRAKFTRMVRLLLSHAEVLGFYPALDQTKRNHLFCDTCGVEVKQGHKKSLHFDGLAVDIILYNADMKYLTHPDYYSELHSFWDSLNGAERIEGDLNHFSFNPGGTMR